MANNSIGAYAQGGLNDIGAYEKAVSAPAGGGGTAVFLSLLGTGFITTDMAITLAVLTTLYFWMN